MNKREYNSERRRKLNNIKELQVFFKTCNIRENITPRGDGNLLEQIRYNTRKQYNKREYNSERRRKQYNTSFSLNIVVKNSISEDITL